MKKSISLAFLISSTLSAASLFQASLDPNHTYEMQKPKNQGIEIYNGWLFLGDFRAGYVTYDYGNKPLGIEGKDIIPSNPKVNKGHIDSKGFYITPKFSILTPQYNGFSAKATLAIGTDFGINDEKYEQRTFVFDPKERKSFTLLQEAYITYEHNGHKVLIGREEVDTPMITKDDWYMLADTFEVAYYAYTGWKNIIFSAGYFGKMAGVWDSGANGTKFETMADASFVDPRDKANVSDGGIPTVGFIYNDKTHHHLQLWNYYAIDLYNTFFAQYDYTDKTASFDYDIGVQFINFAEVGELKKHNYTNINYSLYSARFDINFNNGFNLATGISKYTDGEGQGATLGAWGGYPYFANGMIFHFFEAGSLQNATSYKAQAGYKLAKLGLKHSAFFYRFTYFDLDPTHSFNGYNQPQDKMFLNGLKLQYSNPNGAYFNATYEHVTLDNEPHTYALRLIGGYRF